MGRERPPTVVATLQVIASRLDTIDGRLAMIEQGMTAQNGRIKELELDKARLQGAVGLMWKVVTIIGLGGLVTILKAFGL